MTERIRSGVAPAYLFLCILLGGSPQGIWSNAALQLVAIAIIAWALIVRRDDPMVRSERQLLAIAAMAVLIVLLQLVPLPAAVWTGMPGREFIANGFQLLGIGLPAMPLSLAPYDTVATLPALLPPLGMLAAMIGLRGYSSAGLAAALVAGALAGVLLGVLQVSSPNPGESPFYLYRISNFGAATGFFANSNHMASLLLVTIPFIAAMGVPLRRRTNDVRMRSTGFAVVSGSLLLAVVGLLLNRSLAGYGLGIPVLLASLTILFGMSAALARGVIAVGGIAGVAAIAVLWASPIGSQMDRLGAASSIVSRQTIAANSLDLAREFAPVGSGLGTFSKLYPLAEDPATVDRFYVNHAHNDYLELAIEMGLPGMLIIAVFLFWWGKVVVQMFRTPASDQFAVAAAIASAAILLHSLVDYPMRTAAISVVFSMTLVLIIRSRRTARSKMDLRPTRHLVID